MKRILVIGSGGAGKSTFARKLGGMLGLEVLHLDKFYWKSGWIEPPKQEWQHIVRQLLERETWVMDGNYSGTLARRIEACDTIIFLDLSRRTCMWRVCKRALQYFGTSRPDMAQGCHERLSLQFLAWLWSYPTRSRPKVLELLRAHHHNKRIIHLRSQREIDAFLNTLHP
jgi:adenylate kinase family enzyme